MKKLLTIIFLIQFTAAYGCTRYDGSDIQGGDRVIKTYDISDFTKLEVSDAFEINVKVGEKASLKITGDENILPYIDVENEDNKLAIEFKKDFINAGNILVEITVKDLKSVDLSGACKITVEGISSDSFELEMSGACSGELSGKVKKLEIDLSGATNLDASQLIAEEVIIEASGASNAELYAVLSVDAEASGASNITIYGDPEKMETDASGASNIKSK
ncbi:hypothetical protein MNBD_IGNAVI01-525 [hydrothermal vent metagenome]|uniref:Putative auto-transporter adhesin head GIN domain-containing protein n=1 Tax=hydrothermal vent metagenome TaxID=652676 RepID=A0A3B1BX78_9ZZZZ